MSKPLSRPHELGRGIGYNIDKEFLLEWLSRTPAEQWGHLPGFRPLQSQAGGKPKRLWLVVKIERSVPVMVDVYPDKRSANRRAEFLRKHMRPSQDSINLIEFKSLSRDENHKSEI